MSQLAIQGNYRAAAAQDVGKVYSRNFARRQRRGEKFAQKALRGYKDAESVADDPSVFLDGCLLGKNTFGRGIPGSKSGRLPPLYVKKREAPDVLKKHRAALRGSFGEILSHNGQLDRSQLTSPPPKKTRCGKEIRLLRSLEIECLNYRPPTACLTEE